LALLVGFAAACNKPGVDPSQVDADNDGVTADRDCDDTSAAIGIATEELCDGLDNDCDGVVDGPSATNQPDWYADADGDGAGDPAVSVMACDAPDGFVADASDCDDALDSVLPGATETCNGVDDNCDGVVDEPGATGASTWYADADGDAYGDAATAEQACAAPLGFVADATDCDDGAAGVNPVAAETCDGVDNDCDGLVDEPGAAGEATWYADADGDAYGDAASTATACTKPDGYVLDATDCDDAVAAVNPGATEICNHVDDNCVDGVDEVGAVGEGTWYADHDGDAYGLLTDVLLRCDQPSGYVADSADCDDDVAEVNPGATEVCNHVDDNCVDGVDELGAEGEAVWYADGDGDTYGDPTNTMTACYQPNGYLEDSTDCDDAVAEVNPAATEVCNHVDDNCVDGVDESGAEGEATWYADADADTFGDPNVSLLACDQPSDYVTDNTDCDDALAGVNPSATEICNDLDDDCVGGVDDGLQFDAYALDADEDGHGELVTLQACAQPSGYVTLADDCDDADPLVYPGAPEQLCSGIDANCDGLTVAEMKSESGGCVYASCAEVLAADPLAPDGLEWLSTDAGVVQLECSQSVEGGGWTKVASFSADADGNTDWYSNSGTPVVTCGGWTVIGGYNNYGGGAWVARDFTLLGVPHTELRGDISFIKIDSWDGESAQLYLDGAYAWSRAMVYNEGSQVCGYGSDWNEIEALGRGIIPHSADTLNMTVKSSLDSAPSDESWGLRSAGVWVR